jgi:hypothetical protein
MREQFRKRVSSRHEKGKLRFLKKVQYAVESKIKLFRNDGTWDSTCFNCACGFFTLFQQRNDRTHANTHTYYSIGILQLDYIYVYIWILEIWISWTKILLKICIVFVSFLNLKRKAEMNYNINSFYFFRVVFIWFDYLTLTVIQTLCDVEMCGKD